jgi:pimeloyl-ACP methyl ester carboxylesterase
MIRRYFKNIVIYLFGISLIGFAVLNVLAYQHAHAMLNFSDPDTVSVKSDTSSIIGKIALLFQGITVLRPQSHSDPAGLRKDCINQIITHPEKPSLGAWYCPGSRNGVVVLFHGYAKDKSSLINEARIFLEAQYSVLLVDFRGSWESSETYTTIGYEEAEDVATSVQYVHQHNGHEKIILYGQSMGAAAIFRAVDSFGIKPHAVIVEGIFDDLLNTVSNRFNTLGVPAFPNAHLLVFWGGSQHGFNAFTHNPVDYARAMHFPIMFLHGEKDNKATLSDALRVFKAVPVKQKQFTIFPDIGHESLFKRHPTKWRSEILTFLMRAG